VINFFNRGNHAINFLIVR